MNDRVAEKIVCGNHVPYGTPSFAQGIIDKKGKAGFRIYECPCCSCYHIGKFSDRVMKNIAAMLTKECDS